MPPRSLPRWARAGRQPRHHLPGLPGVWRRPRQGVPECHDLPHQHPQVRVAEPQGSVREGGGAEGLTAHAEPVGSRAGVPPLPSGEVGSSPTTWGPTEPGDLASLRWTDRAAASGRGFRSTGRRPQRRGGSESLWGSASRPHGGRTAPRDDSPSCGPALLSRAEPIFQKGRETSS